MQVYSLLRKEKIISLVKELHIEDKEGAILDIKSDYDGQGVVFAYDPSYHDGSSIVYSNLVRSLGDGLYSDAYDPSVVFSYPDGDTASLAYALCKEYGIDLNVLKDVRLAESSYYVARSAKEIRSIINHRRNNLKMMVIFSPSSYADPHALASAFQNSDILLLLSNGSKEEKAFKKALDRVIFSPAVKRLSAVIDIKSIDDAISFITPDVNVFEIELIGEA